MYVSASNSLTVGNFVRLCGIRKGNVSEYVALDLLAINMFFMLHTFGTTTFALIHLKDILHSEYCSLNNLTNAMFAGVLIVLGLGTALRLALECCQEWGSRRNVSNMPRLENIPPTGYHPAVV